MIIQANEGKFVAGHTREEINVWRSSCSRCVFLGDDSQEKKVAVFDNSAGEYTTFRLCADHLRELAMEVETCSTV